jgi:hypothetical protein
MAASPSTKIRATTRYFILGLLHEQRSHRRSWCSSPPSSTALGLERDAPDVRHPRHLLRPTCWCSWTSSALEPKHPGLEAYYDTTKVRDSSDLLTAARGKECRPVQNLLFSECRLLAISEPLRRRLHRGVVPGRTPIPPAGCPPSSPPPCWRPPAWTIGPNNFFELAE